MRKKVSTESPERKKRKDKARIANVQKLMEKVLTWKVAPSRYFDSSPHRMQREKC
jgi:hypothetical protein